ncbi:MAG: leucine-rich repeat protein [Lachnospiraceae bacterium]|nr:leucine-rich repeat protein [Lachnospiraceae bacterium]
MRIDQNKVRDQRYFAHSFARMIEKALPDAKDNEITLSRKEIYLDRTYLSYKKGSVNEMVIIDKDDFYSPRNIKEYQKEIYVAENAYFTNKGTSIRAAYAAKKMVIGNGITVGRWVDANESLAVYDDCDLGVSATSGGILSIGKNTRFMRAYAPVIYFGQYPGAFIDPMKGRDPKAFLLPIMKEKQDITYVTGEKMTEDRLAPYSIVSEGDTMIVEGAILQGDIHTNKNVCIGSDSGVLGNVFAEGNIVIERGAFIAGNVFSQECIEIENDVLIGREDSIVSVISRGKLTIKENTVIYGYVSSETGGVVCPLYSEYDKRNENEPTLIEYRDKVQDVAFDSLKEYEKIDKSAFRKNGAVRSVVLPDGARDIGRSMFFSCKNLKRISLPSSLEIIDSFAFADCRSLEDMDSLIITNVKRIGVSALENCEKIHKLAFPDTLEEIGAAGCAGMSALEEVSFGRGLSLSAIKDHAFKDCKSLKRITLPDNVTRVGISAFLGCESLEYISVPAAVENEPGIAEIKDILKDAVLEIRPEAAAERSETEGEAGGGMTPIDKEEISENE